MLKTLNIRDFALIEEACIDFQKGMTVITGETGAGKSLIFGRYFFSVRRKKQSYGNSNECP